MFAASLVAASLCFSCEALRTASQGTGQFRMPLQRRERSSNRTGGDAGPFSFLQMSARTRASSALSSRPSEQSSGSAYGSPPNDIYGTIRVGTPPQYFTVAIDTGSSNLLVTSADCQSIGCLSHKSYSSKASNSAKRDHIYSPKQDNQPELILLDISTGKAEGTLVSDNVCLGESGNVCANTGLVEMTRMSRTPFGNFPFDGILGVGMPQGSLEKRFNFIGNLAEAGALKRDRFSVWLANENDTETSEIIFGEIAQDRMASELLWVPVSRFDTGMWQAKMDDFAIDNTLIGLCGSEGCEAAFDTGTAAIAGPEHMISTLISALGIQQDCTGYDALPRLGISFKGEIFHLDRKDYIKQVDTGMSVECFHQFLPLDLTGLKKDMVLLGDPFMKRYYTVFDRESLNVGLALAMHGPGVGGEEKAPAMFSETSGVDHTWNVPPTGDSV